MASILFTLTEGSKSVSVTDTPAGPTAAFPWAYEKAAWKK